MSEDKCAAFLRGSLAADARLSAAGLKDHGVILRSGTAGLLFERDVNLSSSIIGKGSRAFLGRHSYMNDSGYLRGTVFIGRYCSIGRRVTIGAGGHAMTGVSTSPRLPMTRRDPAYTPEELAEIGIRPDRARAPVIIGNDVWIGDGAVILPGVNLGTGCVIGANAVISRDVDPYAIVAGAPQKVIRYRFAEDWRARLLASRWWTLPHEHLLTLPAGHIRHFLNAIGDAGPEAEPEPTFALD